MKPPPPLRLEVSSALLVPAASYGFVRVFAEQAAVLPLVGAALLSTALAVVCRRLRVPLLLSALLSAGALFVLIQRRYAPGTSRSGVIPTSATIDQLQILIDDGLEQFREMRAPVEALDPFVAAAMIAAWVMAFLTDWGAVRLRLAFEPVLPASLLFIFSAVLGSGALKVQSTVVFAAAVLVWSVAQRITDLTANNVWLAADRRRGPTELIRACSLIGLLAVGIGVAVGPRLPGAEAKELYTWRNTGDPVRSVISPFVNIESRLVTQQGTLLFTVQSERPSYWRIAGLDTYKDNIWSTRGTFQEEDGDLPGLTPSAGKTAVIRQTFTIENLAEIWLPAAFAPSRVVESADPVTWNADTGSLTVDGSRDNSDGLTYSVDSLVGLYTPEELRAAPSAVPEEIAARYLAIPDDLPDIVATEAQAVTAGAATAYDQMLALQEHFRSFTYNVRLSPRTGDPIEQFLDEREGFCQQFSGTFALMARSLGVPARVAVGFTWGDPVDGEPGTYNVTGRQTHAWPEVWFAGLGWVAFEPTPGRGAPDATHNPIAAQQDSLVQPDQPGQETTTTTRSPLNPDLLDNLEPGLDLDFDPGSSSGRSDSDAGNGGFVLPRRLLLVLLIVLAYGFGAPAFQRIRRARRTQQATTPVARVEVAWANASESIEHATGLVRPSALTRVEWAQRLSSDMRVPTKPMIVLGQAMALARYAPSQETGQPAATLLSEDAVVAAEQASVQVQQVLRKRMTWWRRWLLDLDPRRLIHPTARPLAANAS